MANYPVEGNLNVNQTPNINTTSNTSAINRHFNPNINFKAKKAPTYDGTGSWQDFLVQFEMVAQMNGWDERVRNFELATSLKGVAQGVVTDLEPDKRLNY